MAAYRDKTGRWRYRRWLDVNGTKIRISGSAPKLKNTKPGAEGEELAHVARALSAPTATANKEVPTFKDWSEKYMENVAIEQSPSEQDGKRQKLASLLVPRFGGMRLDQIGRMEIDGLRAELKRKGRAASTINNYLSVVGAILRYGVEARRIERVPDLGLLDIEEQPFEVYSDAELAALLDAARGDVMMTCALLLGADAGLRAGEIRALHRANIGNGKLVVMYSDYEGDLKQPKGRRSRTVPMTPRLAAAVQAALRQHIGPRVLARPNGLAWTKEVMTRLQPAKGWHALRHTFCSRLAARGVPATQIQALAGHADLRTTQRYMHLAPDALEAAVLVLDDARAEKKNAPEGATSEAFLANSWPNETDRLTN
jgi:integrase